MNTKTSAMRRNFHAKNTRSERRARREREIQNKRIGDLRKKAEEKREARRQHGIKSEPKVPSYRIEDIQIVLISKNGHVVEKRSALDNLTSTTHIRKISGRTRNCRYERTEEIRDGAVVFRFSGYEI